MPLVSRYFDEERSLGGDFEARAVAQIRSVINSALGGLSARQRTIVERCDFAGETHRVVQGDVALSERHFYRDRAAALDKIGAALSSARSQAAQYVKLSPDRTTASLALANVLFQAGQGLQATQLLEELGSAVEDPSTKSWVFSRLTEFCARLSLAKQANAFADVARRLARESGSAWVEAEAAANAAYALRYAGHESDATDLAIRAFSTLRGNKEAPSSRRAEALGVATELIAERAMETGNASRAVETCKEVELAITGTRSVRPSVRCGVMYWHNICSFFTPGGEAQAFAQMEALLSDALDAGFTAEAGSISNVLAHFHRVLGRPSRALEVLLRMQDMVRQTSPPEVVSGSLLELAAVQMELGQLENCYALIESARRPLLPGTLIFADTMLCEARVAILRNEPMRALRASHRAIEEFTALDRPRLVGHALRYQALALEALGKRKAALSVMAQCLDRLEAYAHVTVVARAHEEAARISGDRQKMIAARRETATLAAQVRRYR